MTETRSDRLALASADLREARRLVMRAQMCLMAERVEPALAAIEHVKPWLATARREVHEQRRLDDGR
jgi:hypothetical protein